MTKKQKIYDLYSLRISIVGDPQTFACSHTVGDQFRVVGENIVFDTPGRFSFYSLAVLIPFFAAKERHTDMNDWMTHDAEIVCPDPKCGARFHLIREGREEFEFGKDTT